MYTHMYMCVYRSFSLSLYLSIYLSLLSLSLSISLSLYIYIYICAPGIGAQEVSGCGLAPIPHAAPPLREYGYDSRHPY